MKSCEKPQYNEAGHTFKTCVIALLVACFLTAFIYRAYVVVGIQAVARIHCQKSSTDVATQYEPDNKVFNYENFYDACVALQMKDYREVFFDLDIWTFETAYPEIVETLSFQQRMKGMALLLRAEVK